MLVHQVAGAGGGGGGGGGEGGGGVAAASSQGRVALLLPPAAPHLCHFVFGILCISVFAIAYFRFDATSLV